MKVNRFSARGFAVFGHIRRLGSRPPYLLHPWLWWPTTPGNRVMFVDYVTGKIAASCRGA